METAGNQTRLLVFVDISVIKLDKAIYYFGKVDPCQVVLSYNIRCVEWKATSVTAAECHGVVIPSDSYVPVNSAVVHS